MVNKWDLVEKESQSSKCFKDEIKEKISPFVDVPILFISTLNKQRIFKAIESAVTIYKNRSNRIPTRKLNDALFPIFESQPPPSYKGKFINIKFCTQLPTSHPQFTFFCNLPQYIKEPYKRFLENKLRKLFNFNGIPIQLFFRKK